MLNARPTDPLDSPEWGDALRAIEGAGQDSEGMSLLTRALTQGDLLSKRAAARRMAEIGTDAAIGALSGMENHEDGDIRHIARAAIAQASDGTDRPG